MSRIIPYLLIVFSILAGIDCPNETAYYEDLDSTSSTFGESIATGQCGCLSFGLEPVGTDTSLLLHITVFDNEVLRGFQFRLIEESMGVLDYQWARTADKSQGWKIWDVKHIDGSITFLGLDMEWGVNNPGNEGILIEVMYKIIEMPPSQISFYLSDDDDIILSDSDGQNLLCVFPSKETPMILDVNWLSLENGNLTLPNHFKIYPNFPNPFNSSTTIDFDLPVDSDVRISIYDIIGREISVLVRERLSRGKHSIQWHGTTNLGDSSPSGIYYVRFSAGQFSQTRKLTLLR